MIRKYKLGLITIAVLSLSILLVRNSQRSESALNKLVKNSISEIFKESQEARSKLLLNKEKMAELAEKILKSKDLEKGLIEKTNQLIACYSSGNCIANVDEQDSNAYDLHIRRQLIQSLEQLKVKMGSDTEIDEFISLVARHLIIEQDIFIQEQALELIKELPKLKENRDALLIASEGNLNTAFLKNILEELSEYKTEEDQYIINKFILSQIASATFLAQPVYASYASKYITEDNYVEYEDALEGLDKETLVYRNLNLTLKDFRISHGI